MLLGTWSISKTQWPLQYWWAAPNSAFQDLCPLRHSFTGLNCDGWGFKGCCFDTEVSRTCPSLCNIMWSLSTRTLPEVLWNMSPLPNVKCMTKQRLWTQEIFMIHLCLFELKPFRIKAELFYSKIRIMCWLISQCVWRCLCSDNKPNWHWYSH